jgi:CubicO group peptidase (beta-lactamase class C family)
MASEVVDDRDARVRRLLEVEVDNGLYPGAVWAFGDASGVAGRGTAGRLGSDENDGPMGLDTLFDLASLTKVVALWAALGVIRADVRFSLDAPIAELWPEAAGRPVGAVTTRQLLTHTAGQPLRANLRPLYGVDQAAIRDGVLGAQLRHRPGDEVTYTDRAALILGWLAEHLSGERLDRLVDKRVWRPLGMTSTQFGPLRTELLARCAPTERDDGSGVHLRGSVHDYSARVLGGICGGSGVFSTVGDLGRFLQALLEPSRAESVFGSQWVEESLTVQTGRLEPSIGHLWQLAPGTNPCDDIWCHFGFTGTALWLSPKLGTWAVLLSNKLYFSREKEPLMVVRDAFRAIVFG